MTNVCENVDNSLMEICEKIFKMYEEKDSISDCSITSFYYDLKQKEVQVTSRLIELNDKDILKAWQKISFYWKKMGGAAYNNVYHRRGIYSDGLAQSLTAAKKIKNKLIVLSGPQKRFAHVCENINKYQESVDMNTVVLETILMQISYDELIEIYNALSDDDKDIKEDCLQMELALDIYIHSDFKTDREKIKKYSECLLTIKEIATRHLQKRKQQQYTKK